MIKKKYLVQFHDPKVEELSKKLNLAHTVSLPSTASYTPAELIRIVQSEVVYRMNNLTLDESEQDKELDECTRLLYGLVTHEFDLYGAEPSELLYKGKSKKITNDLEALQGDLDILERLEASLDPKNIEMLLDTRIRVLNLVSEKLDPLIEHSLEDQLRAMDKEVSKIQSRLRSFNKMLNNKDLITEDLVECFEFSKALKEFTSSLSESPSDETSE